MANHGTVDLIHACDTYKNRVVVLYSYIQHNIRSFIHSYLDPYNRRVVSEQIHRHTHTHMCACVCMYMCTATGVPRFLSSPPSPKHMDEVCNVPQKLGLFP